MPAYLVLGNFSEQGVRSVKDTTKRADAVRDTAKKVGCAVKELYWSLGHYDTAAIIEAPDDAAVCAFALSIGALGNVRTHTMRLFSADEMTKILGRMA